MMMSRITMAIAVITVWSSGSVLAGVNCTQVKKYLDLGRTPQDVSDTMVIPLDEVKKCQAGGDTKAVAPAAPVAEAAKPTAKGETK